jgi:hypothetical protein
LYNKYQSQTARDPSTVLEIGCTLPWYLPSWPRNGEDQRTPHVCISPNAEVNGVINEPVLSVPFPKKKYNLVLCLSSSHLFWGDDPNHTALQDTLLAINFLRKTLSRDGILLVSFPWAFPGQSIPNLQKTDEIINHYLESYYGDTAAEDAPAFLFKMNRVGFGMGGNIWRQADFYKNINLPVEDDCDIPSARTMYFMMWGATENW